MDNDSEIDNEGGGDGSVGVGSGVRLRAGLVGAVVGVGALVGGLALVSVGAGAQPATDASASTDQAEVTEVTEVDDVDEVDEADRSLLEDAFEAHVACLDEIVGFDPHSDPDSELDLSDLTEEDRDAWEAALEACHDLLGPALVEMDEAFADFEQCLVDHGIDLHHEFDELGPLEFDETIDGHPDSHPDVVLVESAEGSTFVEFGDGDGSVTITRSNGELSVTSEGDVTTETVDWDEIEAGDEAFEECEDLLAEDDLFFMDGFGTWHDDGDEG